MRDLSIARMRYRNPLNRVFYYSVIPLLLIFISSGCTKTVDVNIPPSVQKVVVDGSIENNVPPIILLTKSQSFFTPVNVNDLANYFIHGARVKVTSSDGAQADLVEFCLRSLNLTADQFSQVIGALGFIDIDTADLPDICVYTVPDMVSYFTTGNCSFMGKERTTYSLDIISPPLYGSDSVHLTSSTYIPTAIGIDSLAIRPTANPAYRDSMVSLYAYVTVPDTFGNFLRYKTKRNREPFFAPQGGGSVYDDRLWVGLSIGLPLERGQDPNAKFDFKTATYFWKGDNMSVKWSNIDSKTYDFFFTLENDGGNTPFSSPIKIKTNINNGLGVWAGYATKYYSIHIPE